MSAIIQELSVPKIILDTDPGGDDIFAFLWLQSLVKQGLAELVAVTTAEGNVGAHLTFANASKILNLGGFNQIRIGRGVSVKEPKVNNAAGIHGEDGMGNLSRTFPEPTHHFAAATYADDVLIEELTARPGEITIVAIAPLTNLAAAEEKSPGILKKAKQIVVMAGAFQVPGNVSPSAEFNVAYNPEAARKVFASRDDLVLLPMDVTKELIFTPEMLRDIVASNPESQLVKLLVPLCQFLSVTNLKSRETAGQEGFLVHDAATLAYLFYPETMGYQRAHVGIETEGDLTRGQTLFDRRHRAKINANAWVALEVDRANLLASLVEDLKYLLRTG